jgi:diguanylate cyclase (GGDEF)-like protein
MGGITLALIVGLVAILIGAGIGYAFAAGRYAASLFAVTQKQQELQRQLVSAPQGPTSEASAPQPQPPVQAVPVATQEPTASTSRIPALTHAPWEAAREASTEKSPSATEGQPLAAEGESTPNVASGEEDTRSTFTSFVAIAHQAGALMMLDIDHLRKFRERYGRQLGDYVSNHVERVIRDALQETSAVISRYEDQEFLIALPEIAGDATERLMAARRAASEVRAEIQRAFLQVGSERLTVTASIGLAMMETGVASEEIIARADEALHAAKRAGRNCAYYQLGGQCLPVDPLTEPEEAPAHQASASKQANDTSANKRSSCRDRRRHERMACYSVNLIAPCRDEVVPAIDKFERVQFLDLSVSGFSMILPAVPTADVFCVALFNHRGMIFMSAEVVNVRQAPRSGHGKPLVIVGCRFRQRLYPERPMPNLFSEHRQHDAAISAILQSL